MTDSYFVRNRQNIVIICRILHWPHAFTKIIVIFYDNVIKRLRCKIRNMEITLILNTVLLFAQPVAVVPSSVTHVLELPVQSFNYLIVVIVVKSTCSFRGAFTTGVACQQGTFTLLDTWFRPPFGNCLCSNCPKYAVSFPDFSLWILGAFSILPMVSMLVILCFTNTAFAPYMIFLVMYHRL